MKHLGWALLALSTLTFGQGTQPPAKQQTGAQTIQAQIVKHTQGANYTPTDFDMYCSGYITTAKVSDARYIVGGLDSFYQTHFASRSDRIFIHGAGMNVGDKFEIVRPVHNINLQPPYPGQKLLVRQTGQPYFEMGTVKILDVQKGVAIAAPELSCAEMKPGDLAIPFEKREIPLFRKVTLDPFAAPNGKVTGRIVLGNEFETVVGSKAKVYLNIGSNKGLKVGDYLRATRTYDYKYGHPDLGMAARAALYDDTQHRTPKISRASFRDAPRHTLGDMVVLHVHPRSATVMIVTALQEIQLGDSVELMDVSDAPVVTAPASVAIPEPEAANVLPSPPSITCVPSPATVRVGESSIITCDTGSPDNRPLTVRFTANGGKITYANNRATLDTAGTGSGPISVRAVAMDDRNLSSSANTTVNVEPPLALGPPVPKKLNELDFKPKSSYVDNRAKAVLDDVALKMQQEPSSSLLLTGASEAGEPSQLASQRAQNAMTYLTKSKGIDNKRITTRTSTQPVRTVEVWGVPAGATMPPANPLK
ncbi:MAG TPA: OmpA family protein [Candidatus Saccharimonadales bacterium]|nr:OmpA family protein [Candidatus Saccharimonadales bacterium]